MKKNFRTGALLLACSIMLSAAGCGKKEAVSESNITQINVWTSEGSTMNVKNKLVDDFNKSEGKDNKIKIIYEVKVDSFTQSLDLALKSGQAPEIFGGGGVNAKADNGDIVALEDMPGGNELIEKFGPYMPKGALYRGKHYCLPTKVQLYGLIYNTDMFEKAGIVDENGKAKPPVTFEEFRKDAKKLTDKKNNWGIGFPGKWSGMLPYSMMSPMMSCCGTRGYDPSTGKYDYTGLAPLIDTYMGMKKDGSIFPGMDGLDNDTLRAHFAEGGIGMMLGVSWDVGVLNDQFPAKVNWSVAPLPVIDESNSYKQGYEIGIFGMINKHSIDKGVDPDKIMRVYKFFHSDEVITELYKQCCDIPYSYDLIKNVKIDNERTGWIEFSNLLERSQLIPVDRPIDITGEKGLVDIFTNQIWTGKVSPYDGLKQYSDIANKGAEKYESLHSDSNLEEYISKDWISEKLN